MVYVNLFTYMGLYISNKRKRNKKYNLNNNITILFF